jgi:hypothetical protein
MKVGSFSPRVSRSLNSFESKSSVTAQTKAAPEQTRLNTFPRDGFEVRGGRRSALRPQGDGFESGLKPNLLQTLPGNTPVSVATNLFQSGQIKPSPLPKALEPFKGALDSIGEKAAQNADLDTLGKLRKSIFDDVKSLGLKGKLAKLARDHALLHAIDCKAGRPGAQWVPGD